MKRLLLILIQFILISVGLYTGKVAAQEKIKRKVSFKDSLDHAFDLSDYMIYSNGFVVVPTPITEPALGGIGLAIVPIFLKKRAPVIDTVNGKVKVTRVNPDMTGGIAMYTANKSWVVGAFRAGTFANVGITYKVALAYADVNLSFYKTLPKIGDQEFKFNFKGIPVYLEGLKQFNDPRWSAGLHYLLLSTKVSLVGDSLPPFIADKHESNFISQLGGIIQYDGRDNIFTPNKGLRFNANFNYSGSVIGSDFNYWRINYSAIGYTPFTPTFIGGLRIEGQQSLGSPPFYLLPSIDLRGVPTGRYQGNATLLSEVETRWDFYRRWSAVFFGGTGLAYDNWGNMFENPLIYSYGTGFRYLIARKFGLRMGADVARGPEKFAYYIVFGSSWFR